MSSYKLLWVYYDGFFVSKKKPCFSVWGVFNLRYSSYGKYRYRESPFNCKYLSTKLLYFLQFVDKEYNVLVYNDEINCISQSGASFNLLMYILYVCWYTAYFILYMTNKYILKNTCFVRICFICLVVVEWPNWTCIRNIPELNPFFFFRCAMNSIARFYFFIFFPWTLKRERERER